MAAMTFSEYSALSADERNTLFKNASVEDREKIWEMIIAHDKGDTSVLGPDVSLTKKKIVPVLNTNSMTPEEESIIDRDIKAKRVSEVEESLGRIGVSRLMEDTTAKLGTPKYLNEPGLNPSFVHKAMLAANAKGDMRLTPNDLQNVSNNLENRRGFVPLIAAGNKDLDMVTTPPFMENPNNMGIAPQNMAKTLPFMENPNNMGLDSQNMVKTLPFMENPNNMGLDSQNMVKTLPFMESPNSMGVPPQNIGTTPPFMENPNNMGVPIQKMVTNLPFMERSDNMGVVPQGISMTAGHPSAMKGTVPLPNSSIPQPRSINRNNPNAVPHRPGYKVVRDGNNNPVKSGNGFMWSRA